MSGKRRSLLVIAAAAAALAALAAAYFLVLRGGRPGARAAGLWKAAGVEKPNVILITLDTTRADHLPAYGYTGVKTPVLDSLARRGVVFEQCTSASPLTLPSHCTIMTGTYPTLHGVRVNGNAALASVQTTLAEVLGANGYATGAFIGAFVLDGRWGLAQGFDRYDDRFDLRRFKQIDLGTVQRPGNEVVDSALDWLETKSGSPFFAWVHLYDPHLPYSPPEPYASEYGAGMVGLYDGEIAFMDSQIGRLLAWLETKGLARKTILVLVGDHGEGLGEHGEYAHGFFIYDYAVQVPFLVALPFPETAGVRVPAQVSTVDLFPTVLELAGLKPAAAVQGRSLVPLMFNPAKGGRGRPAYSESLPPNIQFGWSPLHSLRDGAFKFIQAPRPELYDVRSDRSELENIFSLEPELAGRMEQRLQKLKKEIESGAVEPEAANLDRATIERLAALGYIGAPGKKASKPSAGSLADPKDKLMVYNAIQQAGELITQEKYEQAYGLLKKAVAEEPGVPQAHLLLATCAVELGRKEEARANLDLLLKESPDNVQALLSMADLMLEDGKTEDVLALCRQALAVDERNAQAVALMGQVYLEAGDPKNALPYLEQAVDFQPKLTQNRLNLAACLVGLKEYARAEAMLAVILSEYPKFPLAHYHLGLLYEEQGLLEKAAAAYSDEIALNPAAYRARFNLGRVKLRLGDRQGYLEEMREVVRAAPAVAEGHLFLARGLLDEPGSLEEAKRLVERGIELARTNQLKALGYFLMADIYNRQSRPDLVREALAKAEHFKNLKE
jgi:arylsulfatase A-like enzyme/thioredoxin-like negative regulator of GroEL